MLQLNDFYLLHGAVLRLLGFKGRIVTFVRIDPTRYGAAGRIWLAAARWCSTEMAAVSRFIQRMLGAATPTWLVYGQVSLSRVSIASLTLHGHAAVVGNMTRARDRTWRLRHSTGRGSLSDGAASVVGGDMGLEKNRAFIARLEQQRGTDRA